MPYTIPNRHGVLLAKDELKIPALYEESAYEKRVIIFRLWLIDDELQAFWTISNRNWNMLTVDYDEVKSQVSVHQDELWQQTLIDFQKLIYGDERMVFERDTFPTIYCSKAWLREFVKFYNGQHTWGWETSQTQYFPDDVITRIAAPTNYRFRINSCPIEIVERDDIWAQYTIMNLRVTSLGHVVVVDDLREV